MKSEFEIAITQLAADRNLDPRVILEAIEMALVSAYKRNYGSSQNVSVTLDPRTGQAQVYVKKVVTEQVEDEGNEIALDEAHLIDASAKVGDFVDVEVKPRNFGRIAAQTAKQVITQRIREAERDSVYVEYAEREGELVNGTIRNVDARSNNVVVSLGKAEAILPRSSRFPVSTIGLASAFVSISSPLSAASGPQITVSRTHPDLLKRLLELEVPEIYSGTVEVKGIAREPGFRSKVAVAALQSGVDPVGSCVGMRGVRIQNIVNELVGEKIDVVEWNKDERVYIANALSPAKVIDVYLNPVEKNAKVIVPDRALSLAIGKEGQNARLAARLTGWRIDIKSEAEAEQEREQLALEMAEAEERSRERKEARLAAAALLAQAEALLEDGDGDEVAGPEEEAAGEIAQAGELEEISDEVAVPTLEELALEVAAVTGDSLSETEEIVAEMPEEGASMEVAVEDEAALVTEEVAEPAEAVAEPDTEPAEAEESPSGEEPASGEDEQAEGARSEEPEAVAIEDFAAELDLSVVPEVEEEEDESDRSRDKSKTRRDRRFEYDEELGRVVARKQHKRRDRTGWGEDWD